jgi:hypothetical protein
LAQCIGNSSTLPARRSSKSNDRKTRLTWAQLMLGAMQIAKMITTENGADR